MNDTQSAVDLADVVVGFRLPENGEVHSCVFRDRHDTLGDGVNVITLRNGNVLVTFELSPRDRVARAMGQMRQ